MNSKEERLNGKVGNSFNEKQAGYSLSELEKLQYKARSSQIESYLAEGVCQD